MVEVGTVCDEFLLRFGEVQTMVFLIMMMMMTATTIASRLTRRLKRVASRVG